MHYNDAPYDEAHYIMGLIAMRPFVVWLFKMRPYIMRFINMRLVI